MLLTYIIWVGGDHLVEASENVVVKKPTMHGSRVSAVVLLCTLLYQSSWAFCLFLFSTGCKAAS